MIAVARDIWRRTTGKLGVIGLVLCAVLLFILPIFRSLDAFSSDLALSLTPPSFSYPLGTDQLGRDLLSRTIIGARHSLAVCVSAVLAGAVAGAVPALVSGFVGRVLDRVTTKLWDVLLAFPGIIIGIAAGMVLGAGAAVPFVAIMLMVVPQVARQARAAAMAEAQREYIQAARALGFGTFGCVREILPNALPPIVATAFVLMPEALILEATLSFLGLGEAPPAPSLGVMVDKSRAIALEAPWFAIAPGATLVIIIISFSLTGLALTDAINGVRARDGWTARRKLARRGGGINDATS